MAFVIPDSVNATFTSQAEPDAGDFLALGDRRTGVISGGLIAAQVSANMTVVFPATTVVINDALLSYAGAASVSIQPSDSNPRFDLIGIDNNGLAAVKRGNASTNPIFPVFDPTTFCICAAIYVTGSSILATQIIDKRIMLSVTFQRSSAAASAFIATTDTTSGKTFAIDSSGKHTWTSSALSRTADAAMQWLTSLTLKSADETNFPTPLIVKAGSVISAATQRLVQFVSSGGTEKAYVNGLGQGYFDNFKFGTGTPIGTVTGTVGDLYVDRAAPRNAALWICESNGNTAWVPFRTFVSSESALPTGTLIPWVGLTTDAIPTGTVMSNGAGYSTTNPTYSGLFALIGYRYGGSGGTFNVPDFRGRIPFGTGGAHNIGVGVNDGTPDGNIVQTWGQMPQHKHVLNDPTHFHPKSHFSYYWKPPSEPTQLRATGQGTTNQPTGTPYVGIEQPADINPPAATGITMNDSGATLPMSVLNPVQGVNWLIKL